MNRGSGLGLTNPKREALTDAWRGRGVGVALVVVAAADEEALKGRVALLQDVLGEAASLLDAVHPAVEAHVSRAGSVGAGAFAVLTYAENVLITFGV